jgi:3-hydroxybutyryl-CoA dehydrogenase
MKIVVVANTEQKEELIKQAGNSSAELLWLSTTRELAGITAADACIDLLFEQTAERIELLRQVPSAVIIINSVVTTLNESTTGFIRVNGWNTFLKTPVIEAVCHDDTVRKKAEIIFSCLGKKTEWLPDLVGFISPRVVASIINEAYFALEEGVSTKEEIDTAMKLGTNYPYGPFEWCKKIGTVNVFTLLSRLAKDHRRYEPAALLTREASV